MAVGGWKSRTTVEDMDLSLRTYVNGWKAIYLNDVVCVNEVGLSPHLCCHRGHQLQSNHSFWTIHPLLSTPCHCFVRVLASPDLHCATCPSRPGCN